MTCCARCRSFQRSGAEDSASRRATSPRSAGRSKEHRHAVDALAQSGERRRVQRHEASALARSFEGGRDRLRDRGQFAGGETDEGHAGAVGVTGTARAVPIAVQGGAVGTLKAVVLADDPLFHNRSPTGGGICAAFRTRVYRSDTCLRRGFSPFCACDPLASWPARRASTGKVTAPAPKYSRPSTWACWSPSRNSGSVRRKERRNRPPPRSSK